MLYFKKYDTDFGGKLIALCDSELLGHRYSEGKVVIDLETYAGFYKGDLLNEEEAEKRFTKDDVHSANIVGRRSVSIFLKKGIISKEDVRTVGEVPFVHVYRILS